jgi:arginine decarboxylase
VVPPGFAAAAGRKVLGADLTELAGTDNLHDPRGAYRSAQERAARLFGASRSFFLVNGATSGVIAAFLSCLRDGDRVIMPRSSHRSAFDGLVLCGASPVFVEVPYDGETGLHLTPSTAAFRDALKSNPGVRALFLTSPTYHGACADVREIVEAARPRGVPVIVDEAWGAHFPFHPELPPPALAEGADCVIHSTHKMLPGLTQTGILHVRGERLEPRRLAAAVSTVASTSPSSVLIVSIDSALALLECKGRRLFARSLRRARGLRARINAIRGFRCFGKEMEGRPRIARIDETRLVVNARGRGISGRDLERILRDRWGIYIEAADGTNALMLIHPWHSNKDADLLVGALEAIEESGSEHTSEHAVPLPPRVPLRLTPREAYFGDRITVPLVEAGGCLAAECLLSYPPGVPVVIPGEEITEDVIEYLAFLRRLGIMVTGMDESGGVPVVA